MTGTVAERSKHIELNPFYTTPELNYQCRLDQFSKKIILVYYDIDNNKKSEKLAN
jgi:hypothetical protein